MPYSDITLSASWHHWVGKPTLISRHTDQQTYRLESNNYLSIILNTITTTSLYNFTLIPILTLTTIALTEEEWAAMASKYRYRINIDKALKDKLVEFIQIIMYLHDKQDLTNTDL